MYKQRILRSLCYLYIALVVLLALCSIFLVPGGFNGFEVADAYGGCRWENAMIGAVECPGLDRYHPLPYALNYWLIMLYTPLGAVVSLFSIIDFPPMILGVFLYAFVSLVTWAPVLYLIWPALLASLKAKEE